MDNQSLNYDFTNLSGVESLMNGPSFTSKGTKFFHFFNISLCGNEVSVGFCRWAGLALHSVFAFLDIDTLQYLTSQLGLDLRWC